MRLRSAGLFLGLCLLSIASAEEPQPAKIVGGEKGSVAKNEMQEVQHLDFAPPEKREWMGIPGQPRLTIYSLRFIPDPALNRKFREFAPASWVDFIGAPGATTFESPNNGPDRINVWWSYFGERTNIDHFSAIVEGNLTKPPLIAGKGPGPVPEIPEMRWGVLTEDDFVVDLDINTDNHSKVKGVPVVSTVAEITDVDEQYEDDCGGYLWVNDDNDNNKPDNDAVLDLDDKSSEVKGENDLEPITLKVTAKNPQDMVTVKLTMSDTNARIWKKATKGEILLDPLEKPFVEVQIRGNKSPQTYYLEGVKPGSLSITATVTRPDQSRAEDKIKATVFGVFSLDWASKADGDAIATATLVSSDPHYPNTRAYRFFPDYSPLDIGKTFTHDVVKISGWLTPDIPILPSGKTPWEVPFHGALYDIDHYSDETAFDGDYPSAPSTPTFGASVAPGYTNGKAPFDNRKGFSKDPLANLGEAKQIKTPTDFNPGFGDAYCFGLQDSGDNPSAQIDPPPSDAKSLLWSDSWTRENGGASASRVFFKNYEHTPCMNWRAAGGCGDTLAQALQISKASGSGVEGQSLETLSHSVLDRVTLQKRSSILTVWRHLYMETDWMDMNKAPGAKTALEARSKNLEQGHGANAKYNSILRGTVVNVNLTSSTPGTQISLSGIESDEMDRFYNGGAYFIGKTKNLGPYRVTSNSSGASPTITIEGRHEGEITDLLKTGVVKIVIADDDVDASTLSTEFPQPKITPKKPDISLFNFAAAFPSACIECVDVGGKGVEFKLYAEEQPKIRALQLAVRYRSHFSSPFNWCGYILSGYQSGYLDDGDGELSEYLYGATISTTSVTFCETIRSSPNGKQEKNTCLHEVGHYATWHENLSGTPAVDQKNKDFGCIMVDGGIVNHSQLPAGYLFSNNTKRRLMLQTDSGGLK